MTADGGTTHSKTNTADFHCWDWLSHAHPTMLTLYFSRDYTCIEFFTSA